MCFLLCVHTKIIRSLPLEKPFIFLNLGWTRWRKEPHAVGRSTTRESLWGSGTPLLAFLCAPGKNGMAMHKHDFALYQPSSPLPHPSSLRHAALHSSQRPGQELPRGGGWERPLRPHPREEAFTSAFSFAAIKTAHLQTYIRTLISVFFRGG